MCQRLSISETMLFSFPAFPKLVSGYTENQSQWDLLPTVPTIVSLWVSADWKSIPLLNKKLTLSVLISYYTAQFTLANWKTGTRSVAKNTCRRLYLAWLDHNHDVKIVGSAPVQWMGSLLSHSSSDRLLLNLATKLASITSLSASRLPPPPVAHHWSELGRWLKKKYTPRDWLLRMIIICRNVFNFEAADCAGCLIMDGFFVMPLWNSKGSIMCEVIVYFDVVLIWILRLTTISFCVVGLFL